MRLVEEFTRLSGQRERGRGRRYSTQARQVAVALCRERRRAGQSVKEIAQQLGLHVATLERWLEADGETEPRPRFHPVALIDAAEPAEPSALSVTLPSGLRIEGLSLSQALELARAWR